MDLKREININEILYDVGDHVKLPFDEEGEIIYIKNILWGCKYVVKITKATLNDFGDEVDFKAEQFLN